MSINGWLQISLYFLVILAVTKPLGIYMFRVFEGEPQPLPRFFGPIDRGLYRLCGVNPREQQTWTEYTLALLLFSAVTLLVTYAIERLQHTLPLNP
ncbi:MAG: potassium-transporting ATPase subunit KdpA, partial [Deltaproteobacteria bacterium]